MNDKQHSKWSILNGVRNRDIEQFYIIKENGVHKGIIGIVKAEADPFPLKLYKLNLMNGKPDSVSLNLDIPNINPYLLAEEIRRYWYFWVYLASTDIIRFLENTSIEDIPEEHEVAYNVLKRRVDDLSGICSAAKFSPDVGKTAKNIAKLLYGAPLSDFDQNIQIATKEVINELQGLYNKAIMQTNPIHECNVKELRSKERNLFISFWEEEPGIIEHIRHNCTHNMAIGLLSWYYYRNYDVHLSSYGLTNRQAPILSKASIFRETIFRYIEYLQLKKRNSEISEKTKIETNVSQFVDNGNNIHEATKGQKDSSDYSKTNISKMNYESEMDIIDHYLFTDRKCVNDMICPKCSNILTKKRYNIPAFDIEHTFISYYVEELLFCPNCSIAFVTEESYNNILNRISTDKLYISPSNIRRTNKRKDNKYLYEPIAGFEFCYEKSLIQSSGASSRINTLSDYSFLSNDGYRTSLDDDQRRLILQSAVECYGKRRVADHLRFLITSREGQNNGLTKYENALRVWRADLVYVVGIDHQSTVSDDK